MRSDGWSCYGENDGKTESVQMSDMMASKNDLDSYSQHDLDDTIYVHTPYPAALLQENMADTCVHKHFIARNSLQSSNMYDVPQQSMAAKSSVSI